MTWASVHPCSLQTNARVDQELHLAERLEEIAPACCMNVCAKLTLRVQTTRPIVFERDWEGDTDLVQHPLTILPLEVDNGTRELVDDFSLPSLRILERRLEEQLLVGHLPEDSDNCLRQCVHFLELSQRRPRRLDRIVEQVPRSWLIERVHEKTDGLGPRFEELQRTSLQRGTDVLDLAFITERPFRNSTFRLISEESFDFAPVVPHVILTVLHQDHVRDFVDFDGVAAHATRGRLSNHRPTLIDTCDLRMGTSKG